MQVQAMFYVYSVEKVVQGPGGSYNLKVVLAPVTRSTEDNVQWSQYTPSGRFEMFVTQRGAQSFFEENLGKDVPILLG